jgi:hypothetical protein
MDSEILIPVASGVLQHESAEIGSSRRVAGREYECVVWKRIGTLFWPRNVNRDDDSSKDFSGLFELLM